MAFYLYTVGKKYLAKEHCEIKKKQKKNRNTRKLN